MSEQQTGPEVPPVTGTAVVVRRPRYGTFIGVGVGLGVVVALVVTLVWGVSGGRDGVDYGLRAVFGYVALFCCLVGAVLGGVVAVVSGGVLDRRARSGR